MDAVSVSIFLYNNETKTNYKHWTYSKGAVKNE